MFKLEDLQTVCPNCNGAGFIQDGRWVRWWAENDQPPPDGHQLLEIQEEMPCEECGEVGFIPTEQGKALLEFLNVFRGRKR